jgi:uncharacterized protein (TIGR02145 family)
MKWKSRLMVSVAVISLLTIAIMASCKKDETKPSSIIVTEDSPVTDYDGINYKTIKIGNQIWMAENLRSTHYADGSIITTFSYGNEEANVLVYGRLYTWSSAMKGAASSDSNPSNVQGIAPVGWHLPSKAEWQQLIDYLGGVNVAGGKLKEDGSAHWLSPNEGATNESKFTTLPAGIYAFWHEFQWLGEYSAFATSTDASVPGHPAVSAIKINYNNTEATIGDFHPDDAVSIRCIKD